MFSLGVIPARGGSKRLHGKNIRMMAGKPLIAWTIQAALGSELDAVIVSTDDRQIAAVAQAYGAWVPFIRPHSLATDTATSWDVVRHALAWHSDNRRRTPANVVLLQPTSPLRTRQHIDKACDIYRLYSLRSLVSGKDKPDGCIYITDTVSFYDNKSFVSDKHMQADIWNEPMPDIDTEDDWARAEKLMKERLCK